MGFVKETIFLPKRKENASSYINININAVGLYDKAIVYISFLAFCIVFILSKLYKNFYGKDILLF